MSKYIFLFDLDNTIANMDHRLHHIDRADPDWDAFEKACVDDPPIESTILLMHGLCQARKLQVWIWTGRSDYVHTETVQWLRKNNVDYDQLIMRPHGDQRTTSLIKKTWLHTTIPEGSVVCAFDDDPTIIAMLRKEGIDCMHVRRGE